MGNPSKQRGTAFESAVVKLLKEAGFPDAERRALAGNLDKGDITLCAKAIIIECKAYSRIVTPEDIERWLIETETERFNADACLGFLVVKRPRNAIGKARVYTSTVRNGWHSSTSLDNLCVWLRTLGYGERE